MKVMTILDDPEGYSNEIQDFATCADNQYNSHSFVFSLMTGGFSGALPLFVPSMEQPFLQPRVA